MNKNLVPSERYTPGKGQFLVYEAEDGQVKIEVRLEDETVWLTQQLMAELFQTTKQNVGQHLKNIFLEGELPENSVVNKFFTTAADGKKYRTNFYNLDAIISVGYRIKSHVATRFRIWATQRLREYIVKGFVLDDERLKNPDQPFDYFDELIRRIPMHMAEWIKKLDAFLSVNERDILTHAGRISHDMAKELAEAEYKKFNQKRIQETDNLESDFDKTVKQLTDGGPGFA
ncbi:MAG: virulence RhuM family protein [Deltaproteobacteria bacterium]|nr:virulence RhuM family protein [Deltaproteobacteria bacterium]MBW1944433.1 virulence RhuM family protein [Deltaproteobacteria bacterium]